MPAIQDPRTAKISIHAPREGSDYPQHPGPLPGPGFLSTLPARGATWASCGRWPSGPFLSTLPARGATRNIRLSYRLAQFLSTLPARGATQSGNRVVLPCIGISIHAPREGSDASIEVSSAW